MICTWGAQDQREPVWNGSVSGLEGAPRSGNHRSITWCNSLELRESVLGGSA